VPGDIVLGLLLFLLVRVGVSSAAFLAVAAAFGALRSWWAPAALLVCALTALAVAGATAAFSARLNSDGYFALLTRFVVIPATLFAGVFFPVEQLPAVMRPVAYALPLWHGVELDRAVTLGAAPPWPVAAHVAYLVVWAVVGTGLAVRSFDRRLRD
jgi:lipooligosaccharide transport system permease protein